MERVLNQNLIDSLVNGDISVYYGSKDINGDLEGLRMILKAAFPHDMVTDGISNYYKVQPDNSALWNTCSTPPIAPSHPVEDFFVVDPVVHNYEIY